nr:hypothetical protein [Tanacetum cinerariifolium]
ECDNSRDADFGCILAKEIHATDDYKEQEMMFVNVHVLMNQLQLVVSTQGTYSTTPRAYRTPTLTAASPQGKRRKQRENNQESYADKFTASMLHDDIDDSGTRIEPGSHKENSEVVDVDEVNEKEKKMKRKMMMLRKQMMRLRKKTMIIILIIHWPELMQHVIWRLGMSRYQVADPKLWEILKEKFEKPYVSSSSYSYDIFACHDEHLTNADPPEGREKGKKVWKKLPRLGKLDLDIMRAFEREISIF